MGRRKRVPKEYRLNQDTYSLHLEQSSRMIGLFPYVEDYSNQEDPWWMKPTNPRKLRRKGTSVGGLDKKCDYN